MPPSKFNKVSTGDRDLDNVQVAVAKAIDPLLGNPLLDGRQVDVVLTGSVSRVEHKLGRSPLGWFVMSVDGDTRLWEDRSASPDRSKILVIKSSTAAVNFSLWVY